MSKLTIPKHSADRNDFIAALKIYYNHGSWLENADFVEKLKSEIGDGQYQSSYNKKAQLPKYFGFVVAEDFDSRSPRQKITTLGKLLFEAVQSNDKDLINHLFMISFENIIFGRYNFGSPSSNSDVEMPNVALRTIKELGSVSYKELAYILTVLDSKEKSFIEAIEYIREGREANSFNFVDSKGYNDNKPIKFLVNIGLLEIDETISSGNTKQIVFSKLFKDKFYDAVSDLKLTNSEELSEEHTNVSEPLSDYSNITCSPRPYPIQQIHFGAPGTGKSYGIAKIIRKSYEDFEKEDKDPDKDKYSDFVFRTTVHNEYSYFDFVGNVMPEVDKENDNQISYDFKPGIFTRALAQALKFEQGGNDERKDVYLIIEEMSRGNIASIFGDVFQLLDRDDTGRSEYLIDNEWIAKGLRDLEVTSLNGNKIYLPRNFHILGTANTSDQNVNVIDTAFKRRFGFVYQSVEPKKEFEKDNDGNTTKTLKTDKDGNPIYLNSYTFELKDQSFEWNKFYPIVNDYIVDKENGLGLSEDKQLGQFFVKFKAETDNESDKYNFEQIQNKVLHYLWEDVQSNTMDETKLIFAQDIKSFSDLYKLFDYNKRATIKAEQIFNAHLVQTYREEYRTTSQIAASEDTADEQED